MKELFKEKRKDRYGKTYTHLVNGFWLTEGCTSLGNQKRDPGTTKAPHSRLAAKQKSHLGRLWSSWVNNDTYEDRDLLINELFENYIRISKTENWNIPDHKLRMIIELLVTEQNPRCGITDESMHFIIFNVKKRTYRQNYKGPMTVIMDRLKGLRNEGLE